VVCSGSDESQVTDFDSSTRQDPPPAPQPLISQTYCSGSLAWVLLISTVEGISTMLKISVIGGRTQPRDPERQVNRVPGRRANDHVKGGQEKGQRARCYAYVKTTWTLRIVFLLWSVISIALILASIAHA
jgi:hypothetical protein